MEAHVLVVEDKQEWIESFERDLHNPPPLVLSKYGDLSFCVDTVQSLDEGSLRLEQAHKQQRPYDIAIVDLEIPQTTGGENPLVKHGLELIRRIPSARTAVVVVSIHAHFSNVRAAFVSGALDFVSKDSYSPEDLLNAVMEAWEKTWMSCRHRESELWKDRLLMQLQQFKDEVADRFTTLLTSRAGRLLNAVDSVAEGLDDRFLLSEEREPDDSIVKSLKQIRSETEQMLQRASELRQRISPRERRVKPVDAMDILRSVSDKLYPAQIFRRTRVKLPDPAPPSVMVGSFSEDVAAILEEVLFGSITAYPSLDKSRSGPLSSTWNEVVVSVNEKDDSVSIIIEDAASPEPLKPYDPLTAPTEELRRRHREWGVWLAQRTAHNIGAQLTVEQGDDRKTRITLILPATHHACTTHNR